MTTNMFCQEMEPNNPPIGTRAIVRWYSASGMLLAQYEVNRNTIAAKLTVTQFLTGVYAMVYWYRYVTDSGRPICRISGFPTADKGDELKAWFRE